MAPELSLPPQVASPTDLGRLLREITMVNENMLQLSIRAGGSTTKMVKISRLMDLMTEYNKLNLLRESDRQALKQYLEAVKQSAPRLHFSFGADPAPVFIEKLVSWLRREISPHLLITVGLQPNIGAGCIVRSNSRQYDFSLGKTFEQKRGLLLKQLKPA